MPEQKKRGVGRGISPRPQPQTGRASFQASGFPDGSILFVPRSFEVMATPTQGLDVVQVVRHREVGKAVDRDDMVRVRGLGSDRDRAPTAVKAVANQSLPLEVSATRSSLLVVNESRFPLVVFQVALAIASLIRLR